MYGKAKPFGSGAYTSRANAPEAGGPGRAMGPTAEAGPIAEVPGREPSASMVPTAFAAAAWGGGDGGLGARDGEAERLRAPASLGEPACTPVAERGSAAPVSCGAEALRMDAGLAEALRKGGAAYDKVCFPRLAILAGCGRCVFPPIPCEKAYGKSVLHLAYGG